MKYREVIDLLHERLRAETLSLVMYGHCDIYDSGVRAGKIEAYIYALAGLDPDYDPRRDVPKACFTPGCDVLFFGQKGNWSAHKYHSTECRDNHYAQMRLEKTGIFAPGRDQEIRRIRDRRIRETRRIRDR